MHLLRLPVSTLFFSRILGIATLISLTSLGSIAFALDLDWKIKSVEGERRLESQDIPGAESCLREALKLVRKNKGSSLVEIASCMQSLASVLQMENQTQESYPLYQRSLRLLEKAYGKNSVKIVPTLIVLGGICESEGDYQKAVKFYERSVLLTKNEAGQDKMLLAKSKYCLGRANFEAGFPKQAEDNYRDALFLIMQQQDLISSDLLDEVLSDYIDLFSKSGEAGKALSSDFQNELLKDQLGKLERTKGVAVSMWNKEVSASLRQESNPGRIDASEMNASSGPGTTKEEERIFRSGPRRSESNSSARESKMSLSDKAALEQINRQRVDFYERMIATDIDSLGPNHPSVARDLSGLASIYLLQKKYDEAKPLLARALKIYKDVYSSDALLVKRTESILGLISASEKESNEGNPVQDDFTKNLPHIPLIAQKLEIALKLNYLAFLNYIHGRLSEAATIYAWALADTTLSCGSETALAASCLTDYSRVLRSTGKSEEAVKMENSAHAILKHELTREAALSLP